jgi:hypothetical protein
VVKLNPGKLESAGEDVEFVLEAIVAEDAENTDHASAYVSIRQRTSAYVSLRQHPPAYVSIPEEAKNTEEDAYALDEQLLLLHVTAVLEYSVDFETGDLDRVREHEEQARVADIHAVNDEREVGDVKDSPAGLSASVFVLLYQ